MARFQEAKWMAVEKLWPVGNAIDEYQNRI